MKVSLLPLIGTPDGTEDVVVVDGTGAAKRTNLLDWATAQLASARDAALAAITSAQTTATTAINALVASAQGYANAAASSASAAATSAGSVPVGAATYLKDRGPPGFNTGSPGAFYLDLDSGYLYGPKTAIGWPLGAVADVNAGWSHYDLSLGAAYPTALMPITRANPATALATNLCYHDAPGSAYQTFAANTPIQRADLGTAFMPQSRNVFLNCLAPVDQPTIPVVAGKIIIWSHHDAGVTVTSAANGAVGTGFGAVASGVPQVLTITTAGNISVTHSGAGTWYACQVEYNPNASFTNNSIATPLIITGGAAVTRDVSYSQTAEALLAALQASAGSFVFEVARLEVQTGFGRAPGLVAFLTNSSSINLDGAAHMSYRSAAVGCGMANQAWNSGSGSSQKLGFAWSTGSSTFGAGDIMPTADAVAFNNGTAITAATIGGLANGQQNLGGWIKRIKWRTANDRISDRALFDQFTATTIPTYANSGTKLFRQQIPGNALPNLKTAVAAVRANTADAIALFEGTSHSAGVEPGSSPSINSMPAKVAARLAANGVPARYAGWFGNNNISPAAGASGYRPTRLTFSAGWSAYGTQLGGASMKTSTNGATITDIVPGTSDTYHFFYWTFPGYGGWTFSDGNGHSKTAAAETAYTASISGTTMTVTALGTGYPQVGDVLTNGPSAGTTIVKQLTGTANSTGTYQVSASQTVASTTIKSIGPRIATLGPSDGVVRGSNTFTYTSNDSLPKTIAGGLERDTLSRSVLCINGGTTLRTAVTLALDAVNSGAAENSVQAWVRMLGTLGLCFTHYEAVTNDVGAVTDESLYTSSVQYALSQALAFGDVMVSGDPPTQPSIFSQASQDRYTWLLYKAAYALGVIINAMPDVLGPRLKWANIGFYKSDGTHFSGSGVLTGNGDIFGNIVADFITANV